MRLIFFFIFLISCAQPRVQHLIPLERRELEVEFDWNRDGVPDKATLSSNTDKDFREFSIWLSRSGGLKKVVANQNFVLSEAYPGAYLELMPNGKINIIVDHSGVGAAEYVQTWTVAYDDDNKFVLSNFTYEFQDLLDEDKKGRCDLDLLSGKGSANGSSITFDPIIKDINSVTINFQPKPCKFKF